MPRALPAVVAVLASAGLSVAAPPAESPMTVALKAETAAFPGVLGLYARDLRSGEEIVIDADRRFPTASVIKVAVMVEAFHAFEEGRLARDHRFVLKKEDQVGGSGVLHAMEPGHALTALETVRLMMALSDNTATNLLIDRLGVKAIDARLAGAYGLKDTLLFRGSFRGGRAETHPELEQEYGLGMTTPREIAGLVARVAEGQVVSKAASAEMVAILRGCQDRNTIGRRLPAGALVANKTGTDEEKLEEGGVRGHVRGDVAYVEMPEGARYVLAILTRRVRDERWTADHVSLTTGADLASRVHAHFTRPR
ncbi:MAG: class A beta-lactamase-related serine hydrolase [Vicinamibacteria bacterium]|nr:class A beta-lactamase-related serine hydrolase [Vicinamibacteria bacterium]